MMDNDELPLFKELDNGTLFMAQQVWRDDDTSLLHYATGAWEWEQASAVLGAVSPAQFDDVPGPTCSVLWQGQHLHIRADFHVVLTAYRRYKQRFGGQYIRLLAN